MVKLDEDKLSKLHTASDRLDKEYGKEGSPSREAFEARAKAFYYAEVLKEQRKQQKMTQQQLADILISNALGLRYSLVVG